MTPFIELLGLPFLVCVAMTTILAYLGIHVLSREIVFVDIALAQIVAVGDIGVHLALGAHEGSPLAYAASLLLDVERHHLRPMVRDVLGEAERLELPDGLADRGDAHPERARKVLEPQRSARGELAEDDRLAQSLERGFRHRAVADGGFATVQGGLHEGRA